MGSEIVPTLPRLMAESMVEVSGGEVQTEGEGWRVTGQLAEPLLSFGTHAPLTVVVRMNPTYHGFDFASRRAQLHATLRRKIWRAHAASVSFGGAAAIL